MLCSVIMLWQGYGINMYCYSLLGSMDPYQRAPRSPRSRRNHAEGWNQTSDDGKSPTTDQVRNGFLALSL